MSSQLIGKVALITGASSGIGRGAAIAFASKGSKLAIVGRNEANLQETKATCLKNGAISESDILVIKADLSREEDTIRAVNETLAKYDRLDILCNAAGIIANGTVDSTPLSLYDSIMNVNCRSIFHMMQLAIPHLKKTKGNVINVSSVCGIRAFPGVVAYNMSKASLDMLTQSSALELAPFEVRVNSVNPGVIVTDLHRRAGMNEETYAAFLEKCKTTHALGRAGTVEEVADAIVYLSTASFCTGVCLSVDGGRAVMCPR